MPGDELGAGWEVGLGDHFGAMVHSHWMTLISFEKITRSTVRRNAGGGGIGSMWRN